MLMCGFIHLCIGLCLTWNIYFRIMIKNGKQLNSYIKIIYQNILISISLKKFELTKTLEAYFHKSILVIHEFYFCRIVTDAINSFQGLLVFIIFISSKKRRDMVIYLLKKVPLPCLRSLKKETPHTSCAMNSLTVNSPTDSSSVSDTCTAVVEISQEQQSVSKTDSSENK